MTISWYPGHMHKTRKELVRFLRKSQAVVEVLDARIPAASANPMLRDMGHGKATIRVLAKADLADEDITLDWQRFFNGQAGNRCLLSSLDAPLSRQRLLDTASSLLQEMGQESPRRRQLLIVGVPNVGKSSLLNHLAERKLAKVGNEPAVTRSLQRIDLGQGWHLVDSPGMMWPKLADQRAAYRLAMLGSIGVRALELEDVAWHAAEELLVHYEARLRDRYGLEHETLDAETVLLAVARTRGCLGRGGAVDWHKTAHALLNDLRSGKLGRISLERPSGAEDQGRVPT